jgi:hypothetical protein
LKGQQEADIIGSIVHSLRGEGSLSPIGFLEALVLGYGEAEDVAKKRREAKLRAADETRCDAGVEEAADSQPSVSVQDAEVVVRTMKNLDDGWVIQKGAQGRYVRALDGVDEIDGLRVGKLDEAKLLRVAVPAIGLRVYGNNG